MTNHGSVEQTYHTFFLYNCYSYQNKDENINKAKLNYVDDQTNQQ